MAEEIRHVNCLVSGFKRYSVWRSGITINCGEELTIARIFYILPRAWIISRRRKERSASLAALVPRVELAIEMEISQSPTGQIADQW